MNRRILGIAALCAALGVCVVAAAIWSTPTDAAALADQTPAARLRAALASVSGADANVCGLREGTAAAWNLTSVTRIEVDGTKLGLPAGQAVPPSEQHVDAVVEVQTLRLSPEGAVLLSRLRQTPGQTAGLPTEPFLLRVAPDCQLTGFARASTLGVETARSQQAFVHQLWWKLPKEPTETAEGSNGTGVFSAVVARGADGRGAFAQRRVNTYVRAWTNAARELNVADSLLTVTYGKGPWFDSASGSETISGGAMSIATTKVDAVTWAADPMAFQGVSRSEADYVWEDALSKVTSVAAAAQGFTDDELQENAMLATVTPEQALLRFAATVKVEPNFDQQWRGMARYLEARPEFAASYALGIQHPDFPANLKAVAFMALGKARVVEARDALAKIRIDPEAHPYDRVRSALALVSRDDVGLELAQSLSQAAQGLTSAAPGSVENFVGRNALLALGMMAGVRHGSDAALHTLARDTVLQLEKAVRTPKQYGVVFGAMGNLGDVSLLPEVEQWSHNTNPEIRAMVPRAVRRLKQEQVGAFMLSWLQRETSPQVKQEIYNVIYHQHLDERLDISDELAAQALKDLQAQPLLFTRQSLVRLLGPVAEKKVEVRRALVEQVKLELGSGSGLYNLISQYVPGADVSRAIDELTAQRAAAPTQLPSTPVNPTGTVTP